MKKLLSILLIVPFFTFGQDSNLYFIEDSIFLAYLQENYPQIIVNDSLDVFSTEGKFG